MEKLLECVLDIGEQMLICGGEVHRVEDSLKRIFSVYDIKRTDVFIITSSMVVTIISNDEQIYTQTRRITEIKTDYERLHKLNELSRKICKSKLETEEIKKELEDISKIRLYPIWLEFISFSIISGGFTLFFGGTIIEALISFIIGAILRLVLLITEKSIKNKIFVKFISAFIATSLAFFSVHISFVNSVDKIIIGNIMTLIPGTGLTTALKDLFVGDSIAGLLRTIEACIIALAIAAGYFSVAFLMGGM